MRAFAILILALVLPLAAEAAPKPAPKPVTRGQLETLFENLAKAETEEDAQRFEQQILNVFTRSGSPSIDLLMSRGDTALEARDMGTAKKLYSAVNTIAPNYAEAWHRRGQLLAATGDDGGAMIAFQRAVKLNPRHFAALAELGNLLDEYGNKPAALKMLRRALALDPHLDGVDRHVRELTRAVEGDEI